MGEGGDAEYIDVEESPGLVARYGNEEEDDDYEDNGIMRKRKKRNHPVFQRCLCYNNT